MKEIALNRGYVALVDDVDFDWLNQWNWTCFESHGQVYARRSIRDENLRPHTIMMHRLITSAPKGMEVDHRDKNGLNNQRDNLRICTPSQNSANSKKPNKPSTSLYKGVCWLKTKRKWQATVCVNGQLHWAGYHYSEIEAAKAYDAKAKELFGEFALLNFPGSEPLSEVINPFVCKSAKTKTGAQVHIANEQHGIICGAGVWSPIKDAGWAFTEEPQTVTCLGCLRVLGIQGDKIRIEGAA